LKTPLQFPEITTLKSSNDGESIGTTTGRNAEFLPFLLRCSLFLAPLLVLGVGLEFALRQLPQILIQKAAHMERYSQATTLLVLGSSHAFRGICPDLLAPDSAYSLAGSGQTLDLDGALYEKYLPSMPRLKRVIVTLSVFSTRAQLAKSTERWRNQSYVRAYGLPTTALTDYLEITKLNLLHTSKRLALHYFLGTRDTCETYGEGHYPVPNPARSQTELAGLAKDAAHWHSFSDTSAIATNRAALAKIVALSKAHQVEVIFLITPGLHIYRQQLRTSKFEVQLKELNAFLAPYLQSPGIRFYNFLSDPRFTVADFYDVDHLNHNGQLRLSHLLADTLLKPTPPPKSISLQ
jgi:hypothetical protein